MPIVDLEFKALKRDSLTADLIFNAPDAEVVPPPAVLPGIDLTFTQRLDLRKPVDLIFNGGVVSPDTRSVALLSVLPPPVLRAQVSYTKPVRFVTQLSSIPRPTLLAPISYDNAVFRGVTSGVNQNWQVADKSLAQITTTTESIEHLRPQSESGWQDAEAIFNGTSLRIFTSIPTPSRIKQTWGLFNVSNVALQSLYRQLFKQHERILSDYQTGIGITNGGTIHWQERIHSPRHECLNRWDEALSKCSSRLSWAGKGQPFYLSNRARWQESRKPLPGKHTAPITPPSDTRCYIPPDALDVDFLFKDLLGAGVDLIFTCMQHVVPTITKIIPIKRAYIVINDLSLTRVDGNYDLPVNALSLNIDMSSWTWSFSASMHASALPMIEPDSSGNNPILRATINGAAYLLIAENVKRDRTFGKSNINVSGRGLSAMLDAPYSPTRSFGNTQNRTAQQLMQDVLTINGVSLDWSIDWRIDDWLVPAGAFSHSGSYMNALTTIANAAGAFIQPDPINQVIRVRPKLPIKPWEFNLATPEIELPSAVITKESISWSKKPDYNAVYISGTSASGILGLVKKTGTAGDLLAPMITDALITNAVAARQRGLTVLADTGKMATYSLSLPVLAETGIIEPGTSVRYKDDKDIIGIVQGVSFTGESDKRTGRQTIEVLTYV